MVIAGRWGLLDWLLYRTFTARLACQSTILTLEVVLTFHLTLEPLLFISPAHCVLACVGPEECIVPLSAGISAAHLMATGSLIFLLPNSWAFNVCSYYVRYLISQKLEQPSWPLKENQPNCSSFTKKSLEV